MNEDIIKVGDTLILEDASEWAAFRFTPAPSGGYRVRVLAMSPGAVEIEVEVLEGPQVGLCWWTSPSRFRQEARCVMS